VDLIYPDIYQYTPEQLTRVLLRTHPDLVGFSVNYPSAVATVKIIHGSAPGATGGTFASVVTIQLSTGGTS